MDKKNEKISPSKVKSEKVLELITKNPFISTQDMISKLRLNVSKSWMHTTLKRMGFVKVYWFDSKRKTPDKAMRAKRLPNNNEIFRWMQSHPTANISQIREALAPEVSDAAFRTEFWLLGWRKEWRLLK